MTNIVELNKFLERTKRMKAMPHIEDLVSGVFSRVNNRLDVRDAYRPEGIVLDVDLTAQLMGELHAIGAEHTGTGIGHVMFTSLDGPIVTTMTVNPVEGDMYVWSFADVDPSTLSVG